jgi:hypothetical protein
VEFVENSSFIPRRDESRHRTILSVFVGVESARRALTELTQRVDLLRADVLQPGRAGLTALSDMLESEDREWPRYHIARGLTVLVVDVAGEQAWTTCRYLVETVASPRTLMLAPYVSRRRVEIAAKRRVSRAAA